MDKFEPMIPFEEAVRRLDRVLMQRRLPAETLPVRMAHGRVLAVDQVSRLDSPAFDKSAMDGYAVLAGDDHDAYRVLETVAAGHRGNRQLQPGTAIKVMTGAAVPAGAGRIIILEHAREEDGVIYVHTHSAAVNICRQGEDIRTGEIILRAGMRLGAVEIATLIGCGITQVDVSRRVRLSILSTGDELVDTPEALAPGKILNTNGPLLVELAREQGMEVVCDVSVPDEMTATTEAIRDALADSDIVVLSGGVSVGEFDYVSAAFTELGCHPWFSRLAVQPGKPTTLATMGDTLLFGLPGNPVSACLMFYLFVAPAADALCGRTDRRSWHDRRLAAAFTRKKAERQAFVPARLSASGEVEVIEYHGSAHLAALMAAEGFAVIPAGVRELPAGASVAFFTRGDGAC